ncbi:LytR C-terminal domain-containing protein [Stackebrandtia soli]|uniref:LytR C-terminal domain-containing protein n=1 Tax=Stackebrandtia soli TaxID=1892856 RepID=UPI0039E780BD
MRIAQVRALIIVGVLVLLAGGTSWWAISHDSQSTAGGDDCPADAVTVDLTLPETNEVTVRVLNATDQIGLADSAATQLAEYGFVIDSTDDAKADEMKASAEIRYGPKVVGGGHLLVAYFADAAPIFDPKNDKDYVEIVLGPGFQQINTESDARQKLSVIGRPKAPDGTCAIE